MALLNCCMRIADVLAFTLVLNVVTMCHPPLSEVVWQIGSQPVLKMFHVCLNLHFHVGEREPIQ